MKFTLELTLGNSAMNSGNDIAHALIDVASRMMNNGYSVKQEMDRKILDSNGNSVGAYHLRRE